MAQFFTSTLPRQPRRPLKWPLRAFRQDTRRGGCRSRLGRWIVGTADILALGTVAANSFADEQRQARWPNEM